MVQIEKIDKRHSQSGRTIGVCSETIIKMIPLSNSLLEPIQHQIVIIIHLGDVLSS